MLIDRVAAMAAIETKANADRLVSLADVRDALNSLEGIDPVALAPRWRDAKTDPPKEDGKYLCNVKSFVRKGAFYTTILRYDEGGFIEGRIYTDDVTHWMELPEPPKEGEKE